jgi:hypothetical protein
LPCFNCSISGQASVNIHLFEIDPLPGIDMDIKLGDKVETPRFLKVRIAAMFEDVVLAEGCGFSEPTHFRDEDYHIYGKALGNNLMLFAAVPIKS